MVSQILQVSGQLSNNLRADFIGIYTGGYIITKGGAENIYNLNSQYFYQRQLTTNLNHIKNLLVFLYPPHLALLIYPLAYLSISGAYLLWGLFNLFLLSLLIAFIYKVVSHQINEKKIKYINPFYFIIMTLLFPPIWIAIIQGQFSILLLTIFWLMWYLLKKKKFYATGLFLSILTIRPHLLIIPLFIFFFKKQWRVLTGFLSGVLILISVTTIAMGADVWGQYLIFLKKILFIGNNNTTLIQLGFTVRGLLQYLYQTNNIATVLTLLLLVDLIIISLLLTFWRGKLKYGEPKFDLQWGLLVMATILASPHFNYHDVSLITMPILLTVMSVVNKIPVMVFRKYSNIMVWILISIILSQSIIGFFMIIDGVNTLINLTLFIFLLFFLRNKKLTI